MRPEAGAFAALVGGHTLRAVGSRTSHLRTPLPNRLASPASASRCGSEEPYDPLPRTAGHRLPAVRSPGPGDRAQERANRDLELLRRLQIDVVPGTGNQDEAR